MNVVGVLVFLSFFSFSFFLVFSSFVFVLISNLHATNKRTPHVWCGVRKLTVSRRASVTVAEERGFALISHNHYALANLNLSLKSIFSFA